MTQPRPEPGPSLEEFEKVAWRVYQGLPQAFRDRCGDLAIRIEEFPDRETLLKMGLNTPYELLGLYHGIDLARKSSFDVPSGPDMVFLYRSPILRFEEDEGNGLGDIIAHVLIHEIGHHFGLSDADMEEIERTSGD